MSKKWFKEHVAGKPYIRWQKACFPDLEAIHVHGCPHQDIIPHPYRQRIVAISNMFLQLSSRILSLQDFKKILR